MFGRYNLKHRNKTLSEVASPRARRDMLARVGTTGKDVGLERRKSMCCEEGSLLLAFSGREKDFEPGGQES
jgi:hypothetical protein